MFTVEQEAKEIGRLVELDPELLQRISCQGWLSVRRPMGRSAQESVQNLHFDAEQRLHLGRPFPVPASNLDGVDQDAPCAWGEGSVIENIFTLLDLQLGESHRAHAPMAPPESHVNRTTNPKSFCKTPVILLPASWSH